MVNLGKPSPLPHPFIWIYTWTIMEMCGIEKWALAELKQKTSNLLYNLCQKEKRAAKHFLHENWLESHESPLGAPPTAVPFHSLRHQTRAWHMLPHAPAEATLNYQCDCTAAETCQQMTTWINDTWKAICAPWKSAVPPGHEINITPLWWALCLKNYKSAQLSHPWLGLFFLLNRTNILFILNAKLWKYWKVRWPKRAKHNALP